MVIWSAPAKADLRAIHDFIAADSPHYARKVVREIIARSNRLDGLPRLGRRVPELDSDRIRELPAYSWRILYEIRGDDIVVLAVIHKRRELSPDRLE